jgi:fatty acid-binding protein DegV
MTIIVADTTCSLPRELLAQRGIPTVPQVVIFGEDSYHDDKELDTATFLQKLKASPALPKTAAPEPPLYDPIFKAAQEKGESVIVIAPSAKVSGTVRSAETAAQEFPGLDVRDRSLTISCNLGSMVLRRTIWQAGRPRMRSKPESARLSCAAHLLRGGYARIPGQRRPYWRGEKLLANCSRSSILTIREGQVEPFEQQRTRDAMARLAEVVAEQCPQPESYLSVMQVDASRKHRPLSTS